LPSRSARILSGDGLCGVDAEQRIVLWNSVAESLLGYAEAEVKGRHCFEILSATDDLGRRVCKFGCANFTQALQRKPIAARTLRTKTKLGETVWLSVHSLLLPTSCSDGTVLIHLFRDISRLKRLDIGVQQLLGQVGMAGATPSDQDFPIVGPADVGRRLTSREREVLSLLASGASTRQIAETLAVSVATVRNHIGHVLSKLSVHSRLQAVAQGIQHELL
jgi:PAS domain S-box-containing protein